ncbi:MAG: exosortase-associated protein EpsI, B-type, partial [Candidatus Methylumidiphilus sp.]
MESKPALGHYDLKPFLIGLAMILSAVLAIAMKPTVRVADTGAKFDLEAMIPKQFGSWTIDESVVPVITDPQVKALLNRIYDQTISRTYVNDKGDRIMLAIAYGGDQGDSMQMHYPEVCYPAQGFQVMKTSEGSLPTPFGNIAVKRLVASQGLRVEPVTYWTTMGDKVVTSGLRRKLEQIKHVTLNGTIPDGLLFRVSSIQKDESTAYEIQSQFVGDLLRALDTPSRFR